MKYLPIFLLIFSCSGNNEKIQMIQDLKIENDYLKTSAEALREKNDSLQNELNNCKLNYRALDSATE